MPAKAQPKALLLSPDDPAGVAARAVVRFHLRSFAREEGPARAGEVEPVHQLRVATRRLRASLRLFAPVLPTAFVEWARREVAWLAAAIGGVRDLDVLGLVVSDGAGRLDSELRGALGPLAVAIHDRRAAAHAALVVTLDSSRCRRLLDRLAAFAGSAAPARQRELLGEAAPALLRPLARDVLRAGRRLGDDSPPEALHRLRVRAKRLRYALETLRGLEGKRLPKLLRRLERLQERLGDLQDATSATRWLRSWADTAVAPAPTLLAAGALLHVLGRRARKLRRGFPRVWRGLARGALERSLVAGRAAEGGPKVRRLRAAG